MNKSALIVCLLACGAISLRAENVKERWGFGGGLGLSDFLISSEVREATKPGVYSGAWLRYGATERGEILVAIDNVQAGGENNHPMARLRPVTANWVQSFGKGRWSPYVSAGAGPAWVRGTGETYKDRMLLSFRGGLGLERRVGDVLGIGAGMTYHYAFSDGRYTPSSSALAFQLSGNYFFYCGKKPETKAVVPPPAPPSIMDADGDGVPDPRDTCPGTPKGTVVDALGCPKDSDGDDVLDSDDKCPDTPAGSLVNEEGCPVVKVSVSLDVKFVSGKSALAPGTDEQLKKVSAFMQKHSATTIVIEGHSDNVGGAAMNKKLSQQRADVVRKELVEKFGIAADRITAKGFGLEVPIADNATAEGRAANRRVVATLSASVVKK